MNPYAGCVECGNDAPAEGYDMCLDCLERLEDEPPPISNPTLTEGTQR